MVHRCCSKQKVKRGLWSPEEDEKLINFITTQPHSSWSSLPKLAGLQRCGKSCRLRWINYLRPDLKKGSFNEEEERTIIEVHRTLGNKWAQIAKHLPGRTDNEVKNFWNSSLKKKLLSQGLDPTTHKLIPPIKTHNIDHQSTPVTVNPFGYSGFGWKLLENDHHTCPLMVKDGPVDGNSMWVKSFEDQQVQQRLQMTQLADDHLGIDDDADLSIYRLSSSEFGFGDLSSLLQGTGVFGD